MGYIAIIKMAKKEGGEQMKEGKIIAISNQKGGTAKTTSTFSLGVALAKKGQKVLLVDADPQGDLTTYMGWHNVDEIPITLSSRDGRRPGPRPCPRRRPASARRPCCAAHSPSP